jgi:outer membrane usher protein
MPFADRVSFARDIAIGALLGIPMISPTGLAQAQTQEELFERIFGRRGAASATPVPIGLTVNGQPAGEVQAIVPAPGQPMKVDGTELVRLLQSLVDPEAIRSIEAAVGPDNRVDLDRVRGAGIEANYNPSLLRLELVVPPELRRTVAVDLRSRLPPRGAGKILTPSPFSAYLNLRGGADYVHAAPSTAVTEGRQPGRADLDAAIQFGGNVIEAAAFYTEGVQPDWQRGDIRLVHDDTPNRVRVTLGDFSSATAGFQSSRPVAGLNIARNFSLQPYRATEPIGRTSYLLKRPSKVEIFVNERLVRTLEQAPGPYEMRDLPFATGANDVRLRITDDVGNVEELNFPYFFDSQLLAVGEEEFSVGIGMPARTVQGRRAYDDSFPTFTGFHRFGLTDTVTLGSNFQADDKQHMIGVETLWASPVGTLRFDLGASRTNAVGNDFTARLQHRYSETRGAANANRTLSLSAQYTGRRFAALGNLAPDNAIASTYSARYSQRLWGDVSIGLGASYDVGRGSRRDSDSENVSLNYRVARGVSASVSVDRIARSTGVVEQRAFLSLNAALGDLKQTLTATRDTQSNTDRVDWSYTPLQSVGSVSATAGAQRTSTTETHTGSANYIGNRATASATYTTAQEPRADGVGRSSRSNLRVGTALVYVDGNLGVSRPVTNSFALITRHPNLAEQTIGVDPVDDAYKARTDWLGPPVLPDLQPYVRRNVTIEAPDLPPGYDLGPTVHTLEPTYKSGTRIRVGTDATVFVSGAIEDAEGTTVALQAGRVHSLDEPGREPVMLFTNRNGRFRADGFKPGRYELRMFFDATATIQFSIARDAQGAYDVGTLRLPAVAPKPRGR